MHLFFSRNGEGNLRRCSCERVIRPFILSSTAGSSATCSKNGRTILAVTSRRYNGDARATWTRSRYDRFYLFSLNKCSTKCRCMRDTTVS